MPVVEQLRNFLFVNPAIDEIDYFPDWEFQLDAFFLAETFPFLPVLQPFTEHYDLVLVNFALIGSAI